MHPVRALLGQPRSRSEGPLGAVRTVPEILVMSDMTRKGKGLTLRFPVSLGNQMAPVAMVAVGPRRPSAAARAPGVA